MTHNVLGMMTSAAAQNELKHFSESDDEKMFQTPATLWMLFIMVYVSLRSVAFFFSSRVQLVTTHPRPEALRARIALLSRSIPRCSALHSIL